MNKDQLPQYRDLKTVETAKTLPEYFVRVFENELKDAYEKYYAGAYIVDKLEYDSINNLVKAAFSKGFLAGCIFAQENGPY